MGEEDEDLDPDRYPMAWMRNHQQTYDDEMINFWPLLHPLTNGERNRNTASYRTACYQHGNGHPSHTPHPVLPHEQTWKMGQWLPLDREEREGSREDLWIEAYGCCLQRVAEASSGRSWVTEGEGMAPQVSPLVEAFLSATGRCVSPSILQECWPPKHDIVPRQPMDKVRAHITHCLDQEAM